MISERNSHYFFSAIVALKAVALLQKKLNKKNNEKKTKAPSAFQKRVVHSLLFYGFLLKKMEGKRKTPQAGKKSCSFPSFLCVSIEKNGRKTKFPSNLAGGKQDFRPGTLHCYGRKMGSEVRKNTFHPEAHAEGRTLLFNIEMPVASEKMRSAH